ncbi:hypothetical protein D3C75_832500 [compost metagenome]
MQAAEQPPLAEIGKQERRKLLGEHVMRPDRVPRLARHLVLRVTRRRDMTEVHLGQEADLVIVIKHHPAMTGNAKVLQQHVAREDIRRRQLLDGQAVIIQGLQHLALAGVLQVQVQRCHAPLGPAVADQHRVPLQRHGRWRHLQQFGQALRLELAARETKIGELLGIGHAPDAVDAFHQPVLVDHRGTVDRLRR